MAKHVAWNKNPAESGRANLYTTSSAEIDTEQASQN
jgi:hypothetical protein